MSFVLIVEPEEVNAERIRAILESVDKNFEYELVNSAEKAIDVIEQKHTDVFIADMQMPVIKGTELFAMIEMMSPETIRIVMTDGGRISDTVAFMNECRTFKIIIKPCRVADDLMTPINAAIAYKEQLENVARIEKETEDEQVATEKEYTAQRKLWLAHIENSKRAQDVFAQLAKSNLSASDMDIEMRERIERWFEWMIGEFVNQVLNGSGDYETIARNLTASCNNPEQNCFFEIRKTKDEAIIPQRMNEIAYILTLLTGICKDVLRSYQIGVILEPTERAYILRMRFRVNNNSFRIRNEILRKKLVRATEIGVDSLGYKAVLLNKEQEDILNIAITK